MLVLQRVLCGCCSSGGVGVAEGVGVAVGVAEGGVGVAGGSVLV